ncbi:DUF2628 domain-containing protein [Levilactobacillus brevis]|uniref:DUF2628 domain-containing protein n=1 Tax=Levilactobacillus brevis TaxID=1580 RepID=UPI000A206265|nr:DUF2628 domain-containing protein [Levilactobacillus brevis]ARN91140.1 hypothetical protein AZI09_01375 [Levilactobacillus brevis]ARN98768.1 hypothetical protein AZI10_01365 [Levilactobacillus brevis]
MQDPFKGFNDDQNNNGDGPQGFPLPPNYATVVNPETGNMRIAKVGFSWTMFIFPPFPTIFRADWYNLLCILGVQMGASMIWTMLISPNQLVQATPFFELGIQLLWGLIYNMMYFKHLFNRGFVPADDRSRDLLTRAHYWSQPKEK